VAGLGLRGSCSRVVIAGMLSVVDVAGDVGGRYVYRRVWQPVGLAEQIGLGNL